MLVFLFLLVFAAGLAVGIIFKDTIVAIWDKFIGLFSKNKSTSTTTNTTDTSESE